MRRRVPFLQPVAEWSPDDPVACIGCNAEGPAGETRLTRGKFTARGGGLFVEHNNDKLLKGHCSKCKPWAMKATEGDLV